MAKQKLYILLVFLTNFAAALGANYTNETDADWNATEPIFLQKKEEVKDKTMELTLLLIVFSLLHGALLVLITMIVLLTIYDFEKHKKKEEPKKKSAPMDYDFVLDPQPVARHVDVVTEEDMLDTPPAPQPPPPPPSTAPPPPTAPTNAPPTATPTNDLKESQSRAQLLIGSREKIEEDEKKVEKKTEKTVRIKKEFHVRKKSTSSAETSKISKTQQDFIDQKVKNAAKREADSLFTDRGQLFINTQHVLAIDFADAFKKDEKSKIEEKPEKLENVTFDEKKYEFYQCGPKTDVFQCERSLAPESSGSSIMTASVRLKSLKRY